MDAETSEIVTIVVKSPYQNFPDQTLSCPIEWSVLQLKEEISHTCPSHPSIKEQKLIYWGKLLEDKAQLRDTLKIYEEGQSNHTVHLILKNDQANVKTEGLRKRPVNTPAQASTSAPLPSQPDTRLPPNLWNPAYFQQFNPAFSGGHYPTFQPNVSSQMPTHQSGYNVQNNQMGYQQQVTAMQQAYVQYMQQYMQLMSGGVPLSPPPPFLQTNIPAPQPHNAEANLNNPDNPVDGRPRDWLDWFYLSTRALIFLTVVCFYSSPFRFLLVLVIGFTIYLYQSGFFRYTGPAILIPEQPEPPREPAQDQPNQHQPDTGDSQSTTPAEDGQSENSRNSAPQRANSDTTSSPTQREDVQSTILTRDEEQPTLLGLTWSIVANFFASLLPEQTGIM